MSPVLPGNCKEKEKLKGGVPQIAREKHKWVKACNKIHIYIIRVCVYAHVYTHVNSTDMNDYQLQQVCDQHLDIICPKLRPVNRQRKNSISTLLSTPTLPKLVIFFSRCVPFHSRCALGFSHLLSSQMLKGIRVFSYIQTRITNHICASFARNVNRI